MDNLIYILHITFWLMTTTAGGFLDDSIGTINDKPRCGDWIPFKNEKCFKITDESIHKNQQDAELVCEALSEELKRESLPKITTVKSQEEQEFLQSLLIENNIFDNAWLGLKNERNTEELTWNDGTKLMYSNWANQTKSTAEQQCVEMASGSGGFEAGSWIKVNCNKRNRVICERKQTWTLDTLQTLFLKYKSETQREIVSLRLEYENHVLDLKKNPVPLGFIYVQLPEQQPPTALWPHIQWTDVSSSYAGLFFRVVGGESAPFGQVQDANTKRLEQVKHILNAGHTGPLTIPFDGSWSETFHTGGYTPGQDQRFTTSFRLSTAEIRPRNQAVKVWKRSQ